MTDEKSLLRCTVVKSLHVTERLIMYTAYCIVGVAIIGCAGYLGSLGIPKLIDIIWGASSIVASVLVSIPTVVYVIASIPTAIVVYSLAWCVARELTIDDWTSGDADVCAAFAIAAFAAVDVAAFAAFAFAVAAFAVAAFAAFAAFAAVAFAVAAAVAFAVTATLVCEDYTGTPIQKIARVGGAYYHYRKRINSEKSE